MNLTESAVHFGSVQSRRDEMSVMWTLLFAGDDILQHFLKFVEDLKAHSHRRDETKL